MSLDENDDIDRDPSGFVTTPPSVVVRVDGTARADINGLLGIVVSFNLQHERYLVHMTKSQSTMALKKENLVLAGVLESYRAQVEQLRYDPRVREKMAKYMNLCQKFVLPFRLSHVVGGCLAIFFVLVYSVGFGKTLMTTSVLTLIATIAWQDIALGPNAVVKNFPERAKTNMEKQIPMLRGKLTNKLAVGIIAAMVLFCLQSLAFHNYDKPKTHHRKNRSSMKHHSKSTASSESNSRIKNKMEYATMDMDLLEKYYNMGYEDASKGRMHGASLESSGASVRATTTAHASRKKSRVVVPPKVVEEVATIERVLENEDEEYEETIWEALNASVDEHYGKKRKSLTAKLLRLPNIASIIYLYRNTVELGTEASTGLFSIGQLAANVQHHTEWWRKILLALSLYNFLRVFV